ncbi:hypothetical protein AAFC00_006211 [Neodothiora populina]|uniref:Uncharacterized protein n=1 Tax=Neodothiora populina TaxID=2781224 RepID=A0ABR3P4P5_9PEZI
MAATATATAPEPRTLLPPLLACLPTAFVSPHPPPALLPLLSPILRQRVTLLSGNTSSGNGGWLSLLSWDTSRASKLGKHLEGVQFEAHPVSGELELEQDVETIKWRRLDEETLQARLEVKEFDLLPVYLWVENDEGPGGGEGPGWRLAELRVLGDAREDESEWFDSAEEATAATASGKAAVGSAQASVLAQQQESQIDDDDDDDDDDDYWNAYDRTPGRTPARTPAKHSPAPTAAAQTSSLRNQVQVGPTSEELEYFSRYASEVQPALDSHDPDEEHEDLLLGGDDDEQQQQTQGSTLIGDELTKAMHQQQQQQQQQQQRETIHAPLATTSSSRTSSVDRLEEHAAATAVRHGHNNGDVPTVRAETGVRQFISTEIKSLFRLAKSVGIDRAEFGEILEREIGVLGLLEDGE